MPPNRYLSRISKVCFVLIIACLQKFPCLLMPDFLWKFQANKHDLQVKAIISIILDEPSNTYYICGDTGMLSKINSCLPVVPAESCKAKGCTTVDQHTVLEMATKRKSKQKERNLKRKQSTASSPPEKPSKGPEEESIV